MYCRRRRMERKKDEVVRLRYKTSNTLSYSSSGSIVYHSSSYCLLRKGCDSSSFDVARFSGSRTKQRLRKSAHSGDANLGMGGISFVEAILKIQAVAFLISEYGGLPVSISTTVHPNDQTSLLLPTFFC